VILPDGGPPIRVDFVWRDRRVVIEADSAEWHTSRQRFENDRYRDQRLSAAGWTVIRTTWRQMKFRPHELRPVIVKLLLPAPGSRGARG
jgi:very-short-patch-repair endonuclease